VDDVINKILLALIFSLLFVLPAEAGIPTSAQTPCGAATGAATEHCTLGSAVTSGNTVIWEAICYSTGTFVSIADDKLDTFPAPDLNNAGPEATAVIGHLSNVTSGPSTFTVICSGGTSVAGIVVYEYSNMAASPVDVVTSINFTNLPSPQTQVYIANQTNELGISIVQASSNVVSSVTGWTNDIATGASISAFSLVSPSVGSNNYVMNYAMSNNLSGAIVTYKSTSSVASAFGGMFLGGKIRAANDEYFRLVANR
jgi:hypothetical protein